MRTLVVTRGIPACGKSTWIEDQELGVYTISPDAIRLLYAAPMLLENRNEKNTVVRNVHCIKYADIACVFVFSRYT